LRVRLFGDDQVTDVRGIERPTDETDFHLFVSVMDMLD
jgi:hypothetical protein